MAATTNYAQQYGQAEASVKLQVGNRKSEVMESQPVMAACGHFGQVDHWDDVDTQTDSKTFEEAVAVDGCQPRVAAGGR